MLPRRTSCLAAVVALTLFSGSIGSATAQTQAADSVAPRPGLVKRVVNYFGESNKDRTDERPFDVTFIGGPSYSSDMGFSIGLMAAGLYKTCRGDSLTPVSNATLFGVLSSTGFYLIGIRGNHIAPQGAWRLNYKTYFSNFPTYFWGLTYDQARRDSNKTKYKLQTVNIDAELQFRLPHDVYLGPTALFTYTRALQRAESPLWHGLKSENFSYGAGFSASLDTRDVMTNAFRGVYVGLRQDFLPRFIGNTTPFASTELTLSAYKSVWGGGVLAMLAHAMGCYCGDAPWQLLPDLNKSRALRAYYDGRYRDRCEADLTFELRQHIWRRNGAVIWAGVGYVFSRLDQIQMRRALPAVGVGYRWELKKRVNIRLDYGIGRGSSLFEIGINEAF